MTVIGRALLPFAVVLSTLLCHQQASGQATTGDIVGTVLDQTGAVVSGAKVVITNTATSEVRATEASSSGDYTFSLLPAGNYSVTVTATGFKTYTVGGLHLSAGDRTRIDSALQIGETNETIEVAGSTVPVLQTDSSSVGDTVSEKAVQDLPLNGRNYINLVQLSAGVNAGPPNSIAGGSRPDDRRQSSSFSANGQSELYNNQLIDGLDNNERIQGFIGVRPSIDGIQEVKVSTNLFTAEVGRAAGAVVNVLTKSGTNSFHGSLYEYFRNDIFDARNFFARTGNKPKYRQNQFGGSLGGPIYKNRTFFFGDFEQYRIVQGTTYTVTVPTLYQQQHPGDFSDVGGGVVPTNLINPIALNYFRLYPKPNIAGTNVNNFQSAPNKTQTSTTYDARVDHRFSDKDLFYVRYAGNPVSTYIPGALPAVNGIEPGSGSFPGPSTSNSKNIQLNYTHIFSPKLLMELKAGYTRINISSLPLNYGRQLSQQFGLPNANIASDPTTWFLTPMGFGSDYTTVGSGTFEPILDVNNTFQYAGSLTYNRGSHSIKAGVTVIRRQMNYYQSSQAVGSYNFSAAYGGYGNSMANFLAGKVNTLTRGNALVRPGFRAWEPAAFVQDDWRVNSRLTVNVGLRYELYTPIKEAHDRQSNFDVDSLKIITGTQDPAVGVKTDYSNFSPRIGFAYTPFDGTVIRGGFGMSYYPLQVQRQIVNPNPPYAYNYFGTHLDLSSGPPIPTLVDPNTFASNPLVTALYANPKNMHSVYVEQFNLIAQKEVRATVFTVGYVGELGRQLILQPNWNLPAPPGAGNPTPAYRFATQLPYITTITLSRNGGVSSYHALQTSVQRRYAGGLTLNANYTYARNLTNSFNGSGSTNPLQLIPSRPDYDYGNADIDIRHRAAISVNYAIPFGRNLHGLAAQAAKGWQVNSIAYWQTGLPFTVTNQNAQIRLPGVTTDRPNQLRSATLANASITKWFDTTAFQAQTPGTAGNEGRNQLYGPRDRRIDLSLFKDFPIHETLKLQFRAEGYNITNTPNFALPTSAFTSTSTGFASPTSAFGTISSTAGNEIPRQYQFALKMTF